MEQTVNTSYENKSREIYPKIANEKDTWTCFVHLSRQENVGFQNGFLVPIIYLVSTSLGSCGPFFRGRSTGKHPSNSAKCIHVSINIST